MAQSTQYQALISKLDRFTRKYYLNQIIKGGLLWVGLVLGLFVLFSVLEAQFWFDSSIRQVLFYSFIAVAVGSFGYWIAWPAGKYFQLGEQISHDQAAKIIGKHFSSVEDRLLNILQLQRQADHASDPSLLLAGIDQKAQQIKSVPFLSAIDLGKNRKYLKYAVPPLLLLLLLLVFIPDWIRDSSQRILQNNTEFERPAPFQFAIGNDTLQVIQYGDFDLETYTEGDVRPSDVRIELGGQIYNMSARDNGRFHYRFSQVKKDTDFRLLSGDVKSRPYTLKVIERPQLSSFQLQIQPPAYTGLPKRALDNIGDVTVAEGSQLTWMFETEGAELIEVAFIDDSVQIAEEKGHQAFELNKKFFESQAYRIYVSSQHLNRADSSSYLLQVREDRHPNIRAQAFKDSVDDRRLFFAGEASDDYGLSRLQFVYEIKNKEGKPIVKRNRIPIRSNPTTFDYILELDSLPLAPGSTVSYYFEVYDNDGIRGPKVSRSDVMTFEKPTLEEYDAITKANQKDIEEQLDDNLKERKKLKEEIQKMREKLLNKKEMDWKDQRDLQNLMEKEKQIEEQMKEMLEKFEEKQRAEEESKELTEEQKEKQEKLKEMFEEAAEDERMKELLEKIQELMEEMKKDEALDKLEEMDENQSSMELTTERLEKMFKQLEFEKDLQQELSKVQELAEKLEDLEERTKKGEQGSEELKKEQEEINEEFDKSKEEMKELNQRSRKLPSPVNMKNIREEMRDIQEDLEGAKESLEQNEKKQAGQQQERARKKMQDMQKSASSGMQSASMESMELDLELLRQILENLLEVSFSQEDLISNFERTSPLTPRFTRLTQEQFGLEDKFKIVEDSLIALSKRNLQIESFILDKIGEVKDHFSSSVSHLAEREKGDAGRQQQLAMKNLNDLALMLSEAMQQMQEQMAEMMPGSQQCSKPKPSLKPGSGKKPMEMITEGQKKLNEEMKKKAEENKGKKSGGKEGNAEEYAKMAREQAKLKKMLRDFQSKKREQGQGDQALQEIIDQMDEMETDLVNMRLTQEMVRRQRDIVTRLLESENAERQREQKEERKAEQAREIAQQQKPPALEEYLREREAAIEQIRTVSPAVQAFYRGLVEDYYDQLGNNLDVQ